MNNKIQSKSLLLLWTLLSAVPAFSEQTLEERLIEDNIAISEWFDGMAEGLDLFLAGRKVTNRRNESGVKITNDTFSVEGGDLKNETNVSVKLRLPNVEKYWALKFTSYDEQQDRRDNRNRYIRSNTRQRNYGASVGFFQKLGNVRASFEPRIELDDPLRVSHSLEFESVAKSGKFEFNPKVEFFANPSGTGIFHALNFNYDFSGAFSLTLNNEATYEDKPRLYSVTNGLYLGQEVTEKSALEYGLVFNSNSRPEYHLEVYTFLISWSEMVYRNILDYQITPHLDFARTHHFKGVSGITFTLTLNF